MSDSDREKPEGSSKEPAKAENDSVIDLVEEIEEPSAPDSPPPLEELRQDIGAALDADAPPSNALPDLGRLDFEEDEDLATRDGIPADPVLAKTDMPSLDESLDWLLQPGPEDSFEDRGAPAAASADISVEESSFDQPPTGGEMLLETTGEPPGALDIGVEDDDIELIEIEEDEPDSQLAWLDDLNPDQPAAAAKAPPDAAAPAFPPSDADADLFAATSAADIFAANLAFGEGVSENISAASAPLIAAAATLPLAAAPIAPSSEAPPAAEVASLTAGQIEAAVERLIERKLGGSLESLVLKAVETAVASEIKRLQRLLLEYDPDDPTA
jgi:hypothetical protein